MNAATALYTPQVLALATSLARFPLHPELPFVGTARSATCGSSIKLGLALDAQCRIADLGLSAHACAIGQASAAIFAQAAIGLSRGDLNAALAELEVWLAGERDLPVWPGIAAIAAARAYPARHGAILLSWKAALDALSTVQPDG
ncbi:MAG: iron-sulfur cluster assembly scaffold protein [Sphingomonadales bacterium]|nr:iron-sulfur cluster assembly scaffold protein [Sphingomonadales bacterium]